jgi:hypothetical protein
MQKHKQMKNISGYIFRSLLIFVTILPLTGQDTLRTYGPRIGLDLARFAYLFADPQEIGAELSLDAEAYRNLYTVIETGYNNISEIADLYDYRSGGLYFRAGMDYNFLPVNDRSIHHSITAGFRYGISRFSQNARNVTVPEGYWGDFVLDSYRSSLTGNWFELVGGILTEVTDNFFLGWSLRYKFLLNPEMDPQVTPMMVPGYGNGTEERGFGFSYSIRYKIPLLKR